MKLAETYLSPTTPGPDWVLIMNRDPRTRQVGAHPDTVSVGVLHERETRALKINTINVSLVWINVPVVCSNMI